MKIYFVGSIAAYESNVYDYKLITSTLRALGHEVFDTHMERSLDAVKSDSSAYRANYYKELIKKIKMSDVVVAEVSFPSSINIGHEITLALEYEKPVFALYVHGKSPMMLEGNLNEKFIMGEYSTSNEDDFKVLLEKNLEKLIGLSDIRFNFFISPKMSRFLDWISKDRMIPKAVFLRKLIEDEIDKAKDFPG